MREQPTGDTLLACARKLLRDQLLPALPGDRKHAALMILNAMSIAERQLRNGDRLEAEEHSKLQKLLSNREISFRDGERQLARLIRAGNFDPNRDGRLEVFSHLRESERRRLAESNPKALPAKLT